MATYSANGSGSEFQTYLYSRVEVTRTDSDLECTLTVTCKVVSDGGSSSFISGRVSNASGGWNSWSSEQSVSAYGTTTLATTTFKKSRGSSASTFRCYAEIAGGGTGMYAGAHDSVYVDVTIPAIVYQTPNAPSACSATRNSGTKATVTWTNGAVTTLKPRTATYIERSVDGGAFAALTHVAASASSYDDTTVTAEHYYQYRVRAYNSAGYSSYSTSGYIVTTPNAPSSCSATRNSDAKATVTWTNGSTDTTHPRSATLIERQTDAGDWVQIASVGSTVANYTDNSISTNHRYRYRVRAQNSAGYSSYATSGYIYTTPAAPTAVSLSKTASTTVSVDATVNAPYATGFDVQRSTDSGATWSANISTNAALPYSDTVTGTVRYRVRSNRSNSLYSAWKSSSDITTIVPPDAPTITQTPANPTVYGNSTTIKWTPNHPDGTTQSAAEIKVTNPSGTATTYSVTTAKTYTFTPNATGTWTAQVRTKGLDASYGAWSNSFSWGVYELPSVVITSPATDGAIVTTMPVTISWTVTDSTGVSAQKLSISDGTGNVLYTATPAADVRSVSITAVDVALATDASYSISILASGGSGLSNTVERVFEARWIPPSEPSASVTSGSGGSASIEVTFGTGDVETISADVVRVNSDGTSWAVAKNMSNGESCIDPLPPLGVPVEYRVIASAATGATTAVSFSMVFGSGEWVFNFGQGAQEFMSLNYNPEASYSLEQGGASYHFADGGAGGGRPVWYGTTDRDESGTLTFDTMGNADADKLRAFCDRYPVAWLRDPFGHRWRAHIKPSWTHGIGKVWPLSIDWSAVRWQEGWDG